MKFLGIEGVKTSPCLGQWLHSELWFINFIHRPLILSSDLSCTPCSFFDLKDEGPGYEHLQHRLIMLIAWRVVVGPSNHLLKMFCV